MRSALVLAVLFALGLVTAAVAARPHAAPAVDGTLSASVGPGFSISLTQNGSPVTSLAPGTYDVSVSDTATAHNFHLSGPGVDMMTSVTGTESPTWSVTFSAGNYHYQCDAHPTQLHGDFSVGSPGGTTSTVGTTTMPPPPPATGTTTTATTTTTTATPTTTAATTTVSTTVSTTTTAQTTVASSTTVSRRAATTLAARIGKLHATRSKISLTVTLTRPARATADLFGRHAKRLAHVSVAIRRTAKLTLRPRRPLSPGLYVLRLRFATSGRTVVMAKTVRVA
ncbi:MAG TPA: hypothetical protein VLK36_10815 [Gaiellaceae bacterium]|nr:hypothetical protein [Gaiellaceae bacterium]